jgi:hypothetical protein
LDGGLSIDYDEFLGEQHEIDKPPGHEDGRDGSTQSSAAQRASVAIEEAVRTLEEVDVERQRRVTSVDEAAGALRDSALHELGISGSLASLLNMDTVTRERLEVDAVAVIGRGMHHLGSLVELFQLGLRRARGTAEVFDVPTVVTLLEECQGLLAQCRGDITRVGKSLREEGISPLTGEEYYSSVWRRLDVLVGTLTKRYKAVALDQVFPRETASDIVDWYLTFNVILVEMLRTKEAYRCGVRELRALCLSDPHPVTTMPGRRVEPTVVSSLKTSQSKDVKKEGASLLGLGYRLGGANLAQTMIREAERAAEEGVAPRPGFKFAARRTDSMDKVPRDVPVRPKHLPVHQEVEDERDDVSKLTVKSRVDQGMYGGEAQDHGEGEDRSFGTITILGEVEGYAIEVLKKERKLTELTLRMIRENVHDNLHFSPGRGNEGRFMANFAAMQKKMTPDIQGQFVNVAQWLALLKDQATSFGMPLSFVFQFMKDTGGLKDGHCPGVQDRTKKLFTRIRWLEGFSVAHDPMDDRYWILKWTGAQLKLITEFWVVPNAAEIKAGLQTLAKTLVLKEKVDPVNKEFYLVSNLYDTMIFYLGDRNALYSTSYSRCVNIIRDRLMVAELQPGGAFMDQHLEHGLQLLTTDPAQFLGKGHGLDEDELHNLVMGGEQGMRREDYDLLWGRLKSEASHGSLQYGAGNLTQLMSLLDPAKQFNKAAAGKSKVALQVTSDVDALVLAVSSASGGGGGGDKTYHPPCGQCNTFHGRNHSGPCPFFDPATRKVLIKGMLRQEGVLLQNSKDRTWFVSSWFKKKLTDFVFEALGITAQADKQKVLDDLSKVCRELGKSEELPSALKNTKKGGGGGSGGGGGGGSSDSAKLAASKQKVLMLEKKLEGHNKAKKASAQTQVVAATTTAAASNIVDWNEGEDDALEFDPDTESWVAPGGN